MSMPQTKRETLLRAARNFVTAAAKVHGVTRIALIGSLTTVKPNPKDVDVLVSVTPDADFESLASLGRKLKGRAQNSNLGADIFLASSDGVYLGRTCSYRECHPRVRCSGTHCGSKSWVCDDLHVVTLSAQLLVEPPLELWPRHVARIALPEDTQRLLSESHDFRAAAELGC